MLTTAKCVEVARNAVTEEDWKSIVRTAILDARAGDMKAREWLSRFLLPEKIEDDSGSGGERARIVIFKIATQEDFDKARKEREEKERAAQ